MKNSIPSWMVLLLAAALLLACNFLTNPSLKPSSGTVQPGDSMTQSADQLAPTTETVMHEPDPLDRLLDMRSVQVNLTTLRPDGTSRTVDVEIDSTGNMHLKYGLPVADPKSLPEGVDPGLLPTGYEVYVVDGKAYQPDDQNPAWITAPMENDYPSKLSVQFHGPDGPALWLDLLPLGSINSAGKDSVGGFAADKYAVNGQVDGYSITGAIWFEPQADALVQAELHVPAALFSDPGEPQPGELMITLNAQKADIPPVTLPAAPTN